jgi:hypothetical protein
MHRDPPATAFGVVCSVYFGYGTTELSFGLEVFVTCNPSEVAHNSEEVTCSGHATETAIAGLDLVYIAKVQAVL